MKDKKAGETSTLPSTKILAVPRGDDDEPTILLTPEGEISPPKEQDDKKGKGDTFDGASPDA